MAGASEEVQREAVYAGLVAGGMDEETARRQAMGLRGRTLSRVAEAYLTSVGRTGGSPHDDMRNLGRAQSYHQMLDRTGHVAAESAMDDVERAMAGASDDTLRRAQVAMLMGPQAIYALEGIDPRARQIAQSVSNLQGLRLHDLSGAAVTPPEFQRFAAAWGTRGIGAAALRQGLGQYRAALDRERSNIDRGFPDIVAQEQAGAYAPPAPRRPTRPLRDPAPGQPAPAQPAPSAPAAGGLQYRVNGGPVRTARDAAALEQIRRIAQQRGDQIQVVQ